MNTSSNPSAVASVPKKKWTKPSIKRNPIFFECTAYAGAK
jgi:hypothetical protein